jgi:hypothetical protein
MPIVDTCIIKWSPLPWPPPPPPLLTTCARCWSACPVIDKWATGSQQDTTPYHGISVPDCYLAAISTTGRSALPNRAGLGSRCHARGVSGRGNTNRTGRLSQTLHSVYAKGLVAVVYQPRSCSESLLDASFKVLSCINFPPEDTARGSLTGSRVLGQPSWT